MVHAGQAVGLSRAGCNRLDIIDRRANPHGKNLENRQRVIARARGALRDAVREAVDRGTLREIGHGQAVTIPIKEGEMFLLPANVPHQPRRGANTVGLVIECKRDDRQLQDGLQWYCEKCNNMLHEYRFVLHNIETDFIPRFREFYGSEDLRTCKKCGHVMETDPRFV